jgi:CRISPR/Cas system CSM-associated protein Csm3 (group 7 of RAMP superfamily)
MRTWQMNGFLVARGVNGRDTAPLRLGGMEEFGRFLDRTIARDALDRPYIPGTSLAGLMAALARMSLRARATATPEGHPAYVALFGCARDNGKGQASRLVVHDAPLASPDGSGSVRDRVGINRDRGAADDTRLFCEEVIDGSWRFRVKLEFHETGPRSGDEQKLKDPDSLARSLLCDVLGLMQSGWANIGASGSVGYGRLVLKEADLRVRDRTSPQDTLTYATRHWDGFEGKPWSELSQGRLGIGGAAPSRTPERVRFLCRIRPLEPILVKAGFTAEQVTPPGSRHGDAALVEPGWPRNQEPDAVDAGFIRHGNDVPYVPGSSLRGVLRTRVERVVRTIAGRLDAAWDLNKAEQEGKRLSDAGGYDESNVSCPVSRVFGFAALGSRLIVSDAVPTDPDQFRARLKLLDHVALDRFTGGAADGLKFNARPFFPPHDPGACPDGDLEFEIELRDFESWHLGMLLLLLRDLRLERIGVGFGRNKGQGKVRLESASLSVLTTASGCCGPGLLEKDRAIAGFGVFDSGLGFDGSGYLIPERAELVPVFRKAQQELRQKFGSPGSVQAGGER